MAFDGCLSGLHDNSSGYINFDWLHQWYQKCYYIGVSSDTNSAYETYYINVFCVTQAVSIRHTKLMAFV